MSERRVAGFADAALGVATGIGMVVADGAEVVGAVAAVEVQTWRRSLIPDCQDR